MTERIFLLSPASCAGRRAQMLMAERPAFDLARRVHNEGAPIGEVFTHLSTLYFRGKAAYAGAFARPPRDVPGALVITTSRGLVPPDTIVTLRDMQEFAATPIDPLERRYAEPLAETTTQLADVAPFAEIVLLGSVASGKYVQPLLEHFGDRLLFPADFVGRGDMSRGGLMLRAVEAGEELDYVPVASTPRRGQRPPRLEPKPARSESVTARGAQPKPPAA